MAKYVEMNANYLKYSAFQPPMKQYLCNIIGACAAVVALSGSLPSIAEAEKPQEPLRTRVEPLRTKVHVRTSGLESRVEQETLQHGVLQSGQQQGMYRVYANIALRNTGKAIPGPLQLFYSLCFAEPETKWSACVDGKYHGLPEGIPAGELHYDAALKMRLKTRTLRVRRGQGYAEVPLTALQPEITVRVERGAKEIYKADHLLPPVAEYECKKFCP